MPSRRPDAAEIPALLRKGRIKIAVIGLGRIGLPTAASFAKAGAAVAGMDLKKEVVEETNAGRCWLTDEPGLAEMVRGAVMSGRLRATSSAGDAVSNADFTIICVPTPVYETKTPDYTAIQKASRAIGAHIRRGSIVIVESTVGPGVVEEMVGPILEEESGMEAGKDFGLAACPERSDPGNIMQNMKTLPRIIGGIGPAWTDATVALYEASLGVKAIRVSDPKTANAAKLTENLFRDVNIALANEFALLFEELGVDTIEVINACASKYNFMPHYPGLGVGGPCVVGGEFVFLADPEGLHPTRIGEYVDRLVSSGNADVQQWGRITLVKPKEPTLTMSFDGRQTCFDNVSWFSVRPYRGKVVRFRLSSNRYLTVTEDHPMLVKTARGIETRGANQVREGDEIPLSSEYGPPFQSPTSLDLIEHLQKSPGVPIEDVKVKPQTSRLRELGGQFGKAMIDLGVAPLQRADYRRWNYFRLPDFLTLERAGAVPFSRSDLVLYTSRGSTCRVPAVFQLDEAFWRFIGYYCSEGCTYVERTMRGIKERIKISFGAHEKDLVDDCRSILNRWGIVPHESVRDGSHSLIFSSRIFAFLIRDVLRAGTNSYDKRVPSLLYFSSRQNIAAFIQGLFRGDGWVERSPSSRRSVNLGFATVSPVLFQGTLMLLQAFRVTPMCGEIRGKKSKVPALKLTITHYPDLLTIQNDVGGLPKLNQALQSYFRSTKRSPALNDYCTYKTAFVKEIEETEIEENVYNMEVESKHTFVTSFGIVTHNCLPSNSYYLISEGIKAGNIPYLIRMAREINDRMPDHAVELIEEALNEAGKTVGGSKIVMLGVAYKPNIRDVQLSPVERVVSRLRGMGARVEIYDPMFKGAEVFGLKGRASLEAAARGADCFVVGTAHDEFKRLDLDGLSRLAKTKAAFVDSRNVVSPAAVVKAGFAFRGVGRKI